MNRELTLKIEGKDVKRFIRNLYKQNIKMHQINYIDNFAYIRVDIEDYQKIKKIKTIYEIDIVKYHGILKLKEYIKNYKIFISAILGGIILIYMLSNIIFKVEIIHEENEIRTFLKEELKKYGIDKYKFVKSFKTNEKIVNNILKEHKNKIEWLEIERVGCKYIVKLELRKQIDNMEDTTLRNIVAKKKGLILSIWSDKGEIVKKVNDYVNEGDIIISGAIMNKENIKGYVRANGKIFAETWYNVTVEIPSFYKETKLTGGKSKVAKIEFLNNQYLINNKYNTYEEKNLFSLKHQLLPISMNILETSETIEIDDIYTEEMAILKGTEVARSKLLSTLGSEDEIIYEKKLKIYKEDSKIILVIFYRVKEDITSYQEIIPEIDNNQANDTNNN